MFGLSSIEFFLISSLLGFTVGWLVFFFNDKKKKRLRCDEFYKEAKYLFDKKEYNAALVKLGCASANEENHEIDNLMGHIYGELGQPDNEAWSFHCANSGILSQYGLSKNRQLPSIVTFYYYREAKAFLKAKNWEFAILRTDVAIDLIRKSEVSPVIDSFDYEQELVGIRMMAKFRHFHGSESFQKIKEDAEWLVNNASKKLLIDLANSFINLDELNDEIVSKIMSSDEFILN